MRLLAGGREAPEMAQVPGCSASSVYSWAYGWRQGGMAGLAEGPHAIFDLQDWQVHELEDLPGCTLRNVQAHV